MRNNEEKFLVAVRQKPSIRGNARVKNIFLKDITELFIFFTKFSFKAQFNFFC